MDKLKRYGKRFVVGLAVGLGVWAFMSTFGLAGLVTFASTNPLVNTVYAALFFGAIQTSLAIANDLLDPPKQSPEKEPKALQHSATLRAVASTPEQAVAPTPSSEKVKSHVGRLHDQVAVDSSSMQALR